MNIIMNANNVHNNVQHVKIIKINAQNVKIIHYIYKMDIVQKIALKAIIIIIKHANNAKSDVDNANNNIYVKIVYKIIF